MKNKLKKQSKSVFKSIGTIFLFYILGLIGVLYLDQFSTGYPAIFAKMRFVLLILLALIIIFPIRFNWKTKFDQIRNKSLASKFSIGNPLAWITKKQNQEIFWAILKRLSFLLIAAFLIFLSLIDYFNSIDAGLKNYMSIFIFAIGISVTARIIIKYKKPNFDFFVALKLLDQYLAKRRISRLQAGMFFALSIISMVIMIELFKARIPSNLTWWREEYYPTNSTAGFVIQGFHPNERKITGLFFLTTASDANHKILENDKFMIMFDGQSIEINEEDGLYHISPPTEVVISGSDYYFPFNRYEVSYMNFKPVSSPFLEPFNFIVETDLPSIKLEENEDSSTPSRHTYSFFIYYSIYYKLLVIAVGMAFLGFLIAIIQAKEKDQIIELSLGVFAALIAIRSFLIPDNLSSPLFLDQIFLFYIILLIVLFLYKFNEIKVTTE